MTVESDERSLVRAPVGAVDEMANWTIKTFPVKLRETVVRQAQIDGVTVSQWLEKACDAQLGTPVGTTGFQTRFPDLLAVAANLDLPRWLRAAAARQLGGMLGVKPPSPPKRRQLAH